MIHDVMCPAAANSNLQFLNMLANVMTLLTYWKFEIESAPPQCVYRNDHVSYV